MTGGQAMSDTPATPPPAVAPACRNCGAEAPGKFCPACGQETSLDLPTVRALLREAAGRYVAFDGRMWRTLVALVVRPGFLTREYFAGRRRHYIRPARLFLVLSIGLFALLRLVGAAPQLLEAGSAPGTTDKKISVEDGAGGSTELSTLFADLMGTEPGVRPLRSRADQFNKLNRQQQMDQIGAGVLRYGPYAMIALLPVFALLMKIVYVGRPRRYPNRPRRYAAHLVFGAHTHAFLFIIVALLVVLPGGLLSSAIAIWAIIYLLAAMRAVYGGRWSGIVLRSAVIFIAYSVFFGLVVAGLVVAAILVR
jgi:hypothetical protein